MTTVFIILGILAVITLFLTVSPILLQTEFFVSGTKRSGTVHVQWLHPLIANLTYDLENRSLALRILGWTHRFSETPEREEAPIASAAHTEIVPGRNERSALNGGSKPDRIQSAPEPKREAIAEKKPPVPLQPLPEEPRSAERVVEKGSAGGIKQKEPSTGRGWFSSWSAIKRTLAVLNNWPWYSKLIRWGIRLLRVCLRLVRFDHLKLHATAGMDDPAETGKVYGWYTALGGSLLVRQKNIDLRLEPSFSEPVFEVNGCIGFSTSLYRVLVPVLVALSTFPYFSTWVVWRRLKAIRKAAAPNSEDH